MTRPPPDYKKLMAKALVEIKNLKARLHGRREEGGEPIAIIGMACRFPGGADSPVKYWDLLRDGVDAVTEVPPDRWDINRFHHPDQGGTGKGGAGKIVTRNGGFLNDIKGFDAGFFGISPRECESLDPHQRMLLEVSWEALEHANLIPEHLFGSNTGVFVGVSSMDNAIRLIGDSPPADMDVYYGTGCAMAPIAGRVSHTFGFTGPSFVVDTACSSSLLSLHLAAESLRRRECDLALGGGVHLIFHPGISVAFSEAGMLAPDGRCKTFDAAANGYVRGEGCGMLVLKRLADVGRDKGSILALLRGSAVNQDGAGGGLTIPSGPSQEKVINQALARASMDPSQVDYIEAHGTGTSLGDPIEMGALVNVLGKGRNRPLMVGSVKTNIGHLEASAGIAGVIKVILALEHGVIPPHLHLNKPNPLIPWSKIPVRIPIHAMPWPMVKNSERVAGISSFSFSGTNVHMVLSGPESLGNSSPGQPQFAHTHQYNHTLHNPEPDKMDSFLSSVQPKSSEFGSGEFRQPDLVQSESHTISPPCAAPLPYLLLLSARTKEALRELAEQYMNSPLFHTGQGHRTTHGSHPDNTLWPSICAGAATNRTHFPHRLALIAQDITQAHGLLADFIKGTMGKNLHTGMAEVEAETGRKAGIDDNMSMPHADTAAWLSAPGQNIEQRRDVLNSLGRYWVDGGTLDWKTLNGPSDQGLRLPTYPFQHRCYWKEAEVDTVQNQLQGVTPLNHPLLMLRLESPLLNKTLFQSEFSTKKLSMLKDHRVFNRLVVSGATHLSLIIAASMENAGSCLPIRLLRILFPQALVVPEGKMPEGNNVVVQLAITRPDNQGICRFRLISLDQEGNQAALHAKGRMTLLSSVREREKKGESNLEKKEKRGENNLEKNPMSKALWKRCTREIPVDQVYDLQKQRHIILGPSYRWLTRLHLGNGEVMAKFTLPPLPAGEIDKYELHPGLIDSCFGVMVMAGGSRTMEGNPKETFKRNLNETFIPFSVAELFLYRPAAGLSGLIAHATVEHQDENRMVGNIRLYTREGMPVADFKGLEGRRVGRSSLLQEPEETSQALYRISQAHVLKQLRSTPSAQQSSCLATHLREMVAHMLHLNPAEVAPRVPLLDLGMDSLTAMELNNRLQEDLGITLSPTLLFDHPTIETLVKYLMDKTGGVGCRGNLAGSAVDGPFPCTIRDATTAAPQEITITQSTDQKDLEQLSEAQAQARLLAQLEKLEERSKNHDQ